MILHGKQRNMTLALHDTPYTMAIPHVMKIIKKHHGGRPPIVLLSERDPTQWARRRWAGRGDWPSPADHPAHTVRPRRDLRDGLGCRRGRRARADGAGARAPSAPAARSLRAGRDPGPEPAGPASGPREWNGALESLRRARDMLPYQLRCRPYDLEQALLEGGFGDGEEGSGMIMG